MFNCRSKICHSGKNGKGGTAEYLQWMLVDLCVVYNCLTAVGTRVAISKQNPLYMEIQGQDSVVIRKTKVNAQFAQHSSEIQCALVWVRASNGMLMGSVVLDDIWFFKGIAVTSFEQELSDLLERSFKCQCLGHSYNMHPAITNFKTRRRLKKSIDQT